MDYGYIRTEAKAARMGSRMMAIVAEGERGRVYLAPTEALEAIALQAKPEWKPEVEICHWPGRTNVVEYGMTQFADLFTPRQLVALTTFSDLVLEARERVKHNAIAAGLLDDGKLLASGGTGAAAYGDAVTTLLGLAVARYSNASTTICSWNPGQKKEDIRFTFSRQALPMTWDYAEGNPFSASSGNFTDNFETWLYKVLLFLPSQSQRGEALQGDAATQAISTGKVVSTDPPYYDNIGYADLSDFFYVWQRRALKSVFPDLFATLAVPKADELVATPYRHGGKEKAEAFFLDGMTQAMQRLAEQSHPAFPVTIYYGICLPPSPGVGQGARPFNNPFLAVSDYSNSFLGDHLALIWPFPHLATALCGGCVDVLQSPSLRCYRSRPEEGAQRGWRSISHESVTPETHKPHRGRPAASDKDQPLAPLDSRAVTCDQFCYGG